MSLGRTGRCPKVSVVIPAYNRSKVIGGSIQTVLAQTLQDFEIVVVDDGSTDETAMAVTAIGDSRIKLLRHERNRGVSAARNTGIRACSAPYIAFLDSDDEALPNRLEKQLNAFEGSHARLGLVYVGREVVLPDGRITKGEPPRPDKLSKLRIENIIGGTSVAMIPRYVFDEIGGFDENLRYTEEHDLWLRIAERFPIACVAETLVRIVHRENHGRLSLDMESVLHGREMFRRKHQQVLIDKGVLHLYLREDGRIHHRRGNLRMARESYYLSIRANPVAPMAYVLILLTFLPKSWQDSIARLKHMASDLARHLR